MAEKNEFKCLMIGSSKQLVSTPISSLNVKMPFAGCKDAKILVMQSNQRYRIK